MLNLHVHRLLSVYGRHFNIRRVGHVKVTKEIHCSDACKQCEENCTSLLQNNHFIYQTFIEIERDIMIILAMRENCVRAYLCWPEHVK